MEHIYLDHAATTPVLPAVFEAMKPYFTERFGNPSSLYELGRTSREAIADSRKSVATLVNASPEEIFFTSGGSESDNLAILGTLIGSGVDNAHVVTTAIEHHAVIDTAKFVSKLGFESTVVGVGSNAVVDPEEIRKAIKPSTVLVSVMHANNEVGTIEPVSKIADVCREAGVYFHSDTVQTVGNIPVDTGELGVDMLSMSGHKLYGPKGTGAIYIKHGTRISSLVHGGAQERGMRAGTENVAGIVGLGAAVVEAMKQMGEDTKRIEDLRIKLTEAVLGSIEGSSLNGDPSMRLPNNAHFVFEGIEGEAACLHLDAAGIFAATGSACDTKSLEPSHVLVAMGIERRLANSSIRFTLGRGTTEAEIDYVIEKLPPIIKRLRTISSV